MIIAIDVGNTNIVIGCLDDNRIYFTSRISTNRNRTSDEYAIIIKDILILNNIVIKDITGGIISSVVPSLRRDIREATEKITSKCCMIVDAGIKTGLNILIDNPAQLGSDLVVNAVAAIAEYKKPVIVFDLGTATTLSIIDSKSNYIGGMIIPGLMISLEALSTRTSQLSKISLDAPKNIIGKNTQECMKSGVLYGNAAMLDGIVERITIELGEKPTVIATGGLADVVVQYCKHEFIVDNDLLLKGLRIIYNKNKRNN